MLKQCFTHSIVWIYITGIRRRVNWHRSLIHIYNISTDILWGCQCSLAKSFIRSIQPRWNTPSASTNWCLILSWVLSTNQMILTVWIYLTGKTFSFSGSTHSPYKTFWVGYIAEVVPSAIIVIFARIPCISSFAYIILTYFWEALIILLAGCTWT